MGDEDVCPFLVQSDIQSDGKSVAANSSRRAADNANLRVALEKSELILVTMQCCICGIVFAIPDFLKRQLEETHRRYYCPSGCPQSYRVTL